MSLTNVQKSHIQRIIITCLRKKMKNYSAKDNYTPFHFRLLEKGRMALFSFMQSLNTTLGTLIFEPVGEGAYIELLDCFEKAGIELRPEMDNYFAKFNTQK